MLVAFLVLVLATGAAAPKPPLHIHVFTAIDPSGLVDADQRRRMDSVDDLRGVLDKGLRHFRPVLVGSPDEADVLIEVLSSGMEDLGDRRTVGTPLGADTSVRKKRLIRARVTVGSYTTEIRSPEKHIFSWKAAASHWQRRFRAWANANGERLRDLLAARTTP